VQPHHHQEESGKTKNGINRRESEKTEWWKPRALELASHIRTQFANTDIVLLQEFWFHDDFIDLFDSITSDIFHRCAERRPGVGYNNEARQDGLAILINTSKSRFCMDSVESLCVETAPGRIAQIVHLKEKKGGRKVKVTNVHLSFPSSDNAVENEVRQRNELLKAILYNDPFSSCDTRLEVIGGDFNSDSRAAAAKSLESLPENSFVNCASASARLAQTNGFGRIDLGVTHRTHRGEDVSVDHIFARVVEDDDTISPLLKKNELRSTKKAQQQQCVSALQLGYLDSHGTRILDCTRGDLKLGGECIVSDHRPVTATLEWPVRPPTEVLSDILVSDVVLMNGLSSGGGDLVGAAVTSRGGGRRDLNATEVDVFDPSEPPPWYKW